MIKLDNYLFDISIEDILNKLQTQLLNGKLSRFRRTSSGIKVQCPIHSSGKEEHESCYINDDGIWHCFTCQSKGYIDKFISSCFDENNSDYGKKWLLNNFEFKDISDSNLDLEPIVLNTVNKNNFLDMHVVDNMQSWHPYMIKRKLSRDICEKFKVKYDPKSECIVFPVWDENNNLVMLTRRSVNNKNFFIDKNKEKPVYLLNEIKNKHITTVIICESQINALYAWSLGYPAVALFGTGTKHQYEVLNKSGIRNYILAFDGDDAGKRGIDRFINNIRNDVFITTLNIPKNKDLNDLSEIEIKNLLKL